MITSLCAIIRKTQAMPLAQGLEEEQRVFMEMPPATFEEARKLVSTFLHRNSSSVKE